MATHPLERFALNKRVATCTAIVRRLVKIVQAEYVLNNPRIPRRRPIANQRVRALHGDGQVEDEAAYDIDAKSKLPTVFY